MIHTADNITQAERANDQIGNGAEQAQDPAGEKDYNFGLDAICRTLDLDMEELIDAAKESCLYNRGNGTIPPHPNHAATYGLGFISGYVAALRVIKTREEAA